MKQKEEEWLVINYFRDNFRDFPPGKLIRSESPDFLIRQKANQSVGIELTCLLEDGESLLENIETSVRKKNRKLLLYRHLKPAELWLIIYTDDLATKYRGNFKNLLANHAFGSEYTVTFLFDLFEKSIYPLHKIQTET